MNDALLIRGGRVIDPRNKIDGVLDVLISDGRIEKVGVKLERSSAKMISADGLVVAPGLVDMHVHLREPGGEAKETINTGTRAAASGGVTSVVSMPNTNPPMDNVGDIQFVIGRAAQEGVVRVFPTGTISKDRAGQELSEIGAMARVGCVAITDDGSPVMNSQLMRRAMEYARIFNLVVIEHAEDSQLAADGVMNEGPLASRLGLKGIPRQAEYILVARDLALAELTQGRLHIAHVSCKESVDLVRQAKMRGLSVTAEATPHHFTLTEEAVAEYKAAAKVNPPLRTSEDVAAIKEGLRDGTIDAIASDHAPHTQSEKEREFDNAPFGMIGLETLLPLTVTELVKTGALTLSQALAKLTDAPARVLGLPVGTLSAGSPGDVVIFDPEAAKTFTHFVSRSQNSPFLGWRLYGHVRSTIVGGNVVYEDNANHNEARGAERARTSS
jgi:dihydroorotase